MNFPAGSVESLIVNEVRAQTVLLSNAHTIAQRLLGITSEETVEKILFHLNGEVISAYNLMAALGGVLGFPVQMTKEQDGKSVQFGVEYPTFNKWYYRHNGARKVSILRAGDDIALYSFGQNTIGQIRGHNKITHEIVLLEVGR